jgi:hypothetical protein
MAVPIYLKGEIIMTPESIYVSLVKVRTEYTELPSASADVPKEVS